MSEQQAESILDFWFGTLGEDGWPADDRQKLWFKADPADDQRMADQFGALIADAVAGKLAHWQESDGGTAALIVLADQMTRATGRKTAAAFAGDPVALAAAAHCADAGMHLRIPASWRMFCTLPFQHSESLADQDRSVQLTEQLAADSPERAGMFAGPDSYAAKHREIIRRFGRFPHRNAVLGRTSTAEEEEYLASSPARYGQ